MRRYLGAIALALGLYACGDIDASRPIQTTVADLAKNIKRYEGRAFRLNEPAYASRSGYELHGFLDADGTDRTKDDRVPLAAMPIITERNNIDMQHRMGKACLLLSGDNGTPEVCGVVRNGVFEVYQVTVPVSRLDEAHGVIVDGQEGVFLPPKGVKFNR